MEAAQHLHHEDEEEDEILEKTKEAAKTKQYHGMLRLTQGQKQDIVVWIMHAFFLSLAFSLLFTGFTLLCIAAGVKNALAIRVVIYTTYASLAAIGAIALFTGVLNMMTSEGE